MSLACVPGLAFLFWHSQQKGKMHRVNLGTEIGGAGPRPQRGDVG